jgi:hypothetical protein
MNKETKVILLMVLSLLFLIVIIRSLPAIITIAFNPLRLLLILALLGIIIYMVKKWLDEESDSPGDDLL